MTGPVFDELCVSLGYEPNSVLSIRLNRREVVVTYADPAGQLRTTAIRTTGRSSDDAAQVADVPRKPRGS